MNRAYMRRSKTNSNPMRILRLGCQFYGNWPLRSNVATWKRVLPRVLYWLHFSNEFFGTVAIFNGLNCCFTSLGDFVKSSVEVVFMLETMFNLIYYRWRESQFQRLIVEMERFFDTPNPEERIVRLNYLNRTKWAYYVLITIFIVGGLLFAFAPLFARTHATPVNTVYEYFTISRKTYWGVRVIYALNVIHIVNAASVIFLDLLIISIIWHAACKFRLLGSKLRTIDKGKLNAWIEEHQDAISHAKEVDQVMAPLAIKSTIAVALYMIICGLVIVRDIPYFELTKFLVITTLSVLRFLACSWAADAMTEEARGVAWKIYDYPWVNAEPRIRRAVVIMIQMCQKPITIHAGGFLTAWSLWFCGRVLYTILTYFSTLRAVLRG